MEMNRNQVLLIGLLLVLLGVQFRFVDSFVLNEKTSQFVAKQMHNQPTSGPETLQSALISASPPSRRTVTPPRWLGWSLISIGSVLILHSLAMKKPGG